ncbi:MULTISPECIES: tetratricopeptide repeat protein [Stenotrophomonas]|uniref:Tetratricopeptide repeat protein n=1 Tax=Stenotrophomonas maltophilia TaxID=40324 RepID=A0AAI9BYH7_STEMA|nr:MULTISPECIES: tetratricopeptide repeat protein [Stenotrophomonas]UUS14511.1 putative 2OG-Fe(II) oxygenase [Stenotrophomonas sp. CD2]AWT15871.1 hypothetical protein DM611_17115 [Stenotrophomonas maltophilia]EKT4091997.1 tetratricopeptide repeat protein [Stenotrophomonas maltophilia]MBA0287141.1 hypothetical protein [Stenotrophomonas maltophilia]MBA0325084.1 hypothetical protein [Stenotrophomonas maltophilia]
METLDHIPDVGLEREIAMLFLSGEKDRALLRLQDDQLAQTHPRLAFQLALLLIEIGDWKRAKQQLDRVISLEPRFLPALRRRAALLARDDDLTAAEEDFQRIVKIAPDETSAVANIGVVLLRRGNHAAALPWLQRAATQSPADTRIQHSLANALSGAGQHALALDLFQRLAQISPGNIDLAADQATALLRGGDAASAHARFLTLLSEHPDDQRCWAGRYLSACALKLPEARMLMDYPLLLRRIRTDLDTDALINAVLQLPSLRWEPAGKTTLGGLQSAMLDLTPPSPFHGFGQQVSNALHDHLLQLHGSLFDAPTDAWRLSLPSRWTLQAWATVLHGDGGHQDPHLHPAGRISGVLYLDAGNSAEGDGDLVFGHAPRDIDTAGEPHAHRHVARSGEMLIFPSWFLHHTTPYHGTRPRISLAFDLLPASP